MTLIPGISYHDYVDINKDEEVEEKDEEGSGEEKEQSSGTSSV